jgi:hypothetical protein
LRFFYFYIEGTGTGHVQSVIFSALCILLGALLLIMSLLADLISTNRKLLERIHLRLQMLEHTTRGSSKEDR